MNRHKTPWPIKRLSLKQQYFRFKAKFPYGYGKLTAHDRGLVWKMPISHRQDGYVYKLKIEYTLGYYPTVFLENEDWGNLLKFRDPYAAHSRLIDEHTLHICVFHDGSVKGFNADWNGNMFIADTIVPWSVAWLFYFERWLLTDKWDGGGLHANETAFKQIANQTKKDPVIFHHL